VKPVSIHRAALGEIKAAARWYRERSVIAAAGFLDAIDAAIDLIAANPEAWPRRGDRLDVRAFPFARYPFVMVYRIRPAAKVQIRIPAVAHARRRPDYWRRRR